MLTLKPTPIGVPVLPDWRALAATRSTTIDPGLRPAFTAVGAGRENLEQLFGGALCVTTGQQPGLFGGPLFTLYKALSAIERARQASVALDRPVVPVFWVAGDDHDFAEANHCFLLNAAGDVERIELRSRDAAAALTPLYREILGPDVDRAIERVATALPESEYGGAALELLRTHYRPDTDFSTAFAGFLAELLGSHGLIVFQASHPSVKRVMQPWIERALGEADTLDRALADRAKAMLAADLEVRVQVGEGATLVMVEGRLGRDRLVLAPRGYATRRSGETWKVDELLAFLRKAPEQFSPNVLLRPVVEAAILPTLAYVGGPGELSYLEQADPIYQQLGVAPQARVARWSGEIIEPRVTRVLEKYDLAPMDLHRDVAGQLERRLLLGDVPSEAQAALAALRTAIEREFAVLATSASSVDPTLQKPVESARNNALGGLADIEKRLIGHLKKKNEVVTSQIKNARNSLFPDGQPQERVLAGVSFLGRFGQPFVEQAAQAVRSANAVLEPALDRP